MSKAIQVSSPDSAIPLAGDRIRFLLSTIIEGAQRARAALERGDEETFAEMIDDIQTDAGWIVREVL